MLVSQVACNMFNIAGLPGTKTLPSTQRLLNSKHIYQHIIIAYSKTSRLSLTDIWHMWKKSITPHSPVSSIVLGCEENLYF